jgi:hypothetical protein
MNTERPVAVLGHDTKQGESVLDTNRETARCLMGA